MHQSSKIVVFHLAVVLILSMVLFFYQLEQRALADPDEARYAEGAREMLEIGEWITPQYNYQDRLDKPIFFYWLVMTAYKLVGVTEFAARLFPALFAVVGVLLTYLLGALLFSSRAGLFSAIILATSPLYLAIGRLAVTDMVLSVFILLALCCFSMIYFRQQPNYAFPFFIALGLAMLTKGPVGMIFVFLIILVFLGLRKELGKLRNLRLGWGVCVFLIVTLPWFILLMMRHEGLLRYYFYDQSLSRFFTEKYEHKRILFLYFYLVIPAFFPWIVLFVSASGEFWKKGWKDAISKRPRELMFWLWGVVPVLFFSICQSKLPTYILPVFPGLALFVGQWIDREILIRHKRSTHARSLQVACVLLCCIIAAALLMSRHYSKSEHAMHMTSLLAVGSLAFVFALVGLYFSMRGRLLTAFWLLAAGMVVLELGIIPGVDSYLSAKRSLKTLCEEVRPKIDPGGLIVRYEGDVPPSVVFYLRHRVIKVTDEKIIAHYARLPGIVYVLIQHNDYDKVFLNSFPQHVLIAENEEFLWLANRDPAL